jgi:hypothetical protein
VAKDLGDSLQEARRQRDRLVVACGDLIDRARGGETITAAQIIAAGDSYVESVAPRGTAGQPARVLSNFAKLAVRLRPC